jgi:iron(III) transport system substrate-binding protein
MRTIRSSSAGAAAIALALSAVAWAGDQATATTTAEPATTAMASDAAVAFEEQWAELIAAAQAEGEISFLTGPGIEEDAPYFEAFADEFDLDFANFGGATDLVTARVSAERDQGLYDYDVAALGGSGVRNFLDAGFFTELEPLLIHPDLLTQENFATDYMPWAEPDRRYCLYHAVEAEGNFLAFYYNTDTVSQEDYDSLNSWFDLLDPRWKGRIVIGDIASGEASGDRNLAWETLGQEWYDGLFANEPIVMPYGSRREHADVLLRGDADIALFPPGEQSLQEAAEQGLPVAQMDKTMEEGSPRLLQAALCIMNDAPHPAAAQLFVNWVFTLEGGTVYNATTGRTGRAHIRTDAPIGKVFPEVYSYALDDSVPIVDELNPAMLEAHEAVTAYLEAKYEELDIVPGG